LKEKKLEEELPFEKLVTTKEAACQLGLAESSIQCMITETQLASRLATPSEQAQLLASGRVQGWGMVESPRPRHQSDILKREGAVEHKDVRLQLVQIRQVCALLHLSPAHLLAESRARGSSHRGIVSRYFHFGAI